MPLITILVEDRQAIQEMLVPALAELSDARVVATTTTAGAAKKALALWTGQWHLIVVDLFLAEGSGLEVLEAIKLRQKTSTPSFFRTTPPVKCVGDVKS